MILIISRNKNKILNSIEYLFKQETLEYEVKETIDENYEYEKIIYIMEDEEKVIPKFNSDLLVISSNKLDLKNSMRKINLIITNLVNDYTEYTNAQEEYLFRDGIYRIINDIVYSFVDNQTVDKMIYDTSSCEIKPSDWIFKFDSISESYAWLSRMNKQTEGVRKVVEIYSHKIFNDSDKEINYLSEYLKLAKNGMKIYNIFISTPDELETQKKNKFFDILARKSGENVKTYFIDINIIKEKDATIFEKLKDGILIYNDCVYRDTYDDELSLGVVDCKLETVKEYNEIFDYIIDKYAKEIVVGGNYIGI